MSESTQKLVLADVSVVFPAHRSSGQDDITALSAIHISIHKNDFVVALGASGCGKTTLLNVMAGFISPTHGSVFFQRDDVKAETDAAKIPITKPGPDRGVVFQKHALLPWLNVIKNVAFGLKLRGMPSAERLEIAREKIALMGLEEFEKHKVYELSGGMQQRVGIARALASDPAILLMDEPLGALDALTRETVQEIILRGWQKTKKMVFFITHSVEEALFMSTRLVVMSPRPGRITHEFKLKFSKQFLDGMPARQVKSQPSFITMREKVLDIIHADEGIAVKNTL